MIDEDRWRSEIVEAHPFAGVGLDLDQVIARGERRARRKRTARLGASLVVIVLLGALVGLVVHRSSAGSSPSSVRAAGDRHGEVAGPSGTTTTTSTTTTTNRPAPETPTTTPGSTTRPGTTAAPGPTTIPGASTPLGAAPVNLPIAVQSDAEMKAAGNNGPSSSILQPTSCVVSGQQVTARGGYTNGGFAPNVYDRYGAVVRLYVYTAAAAGYPSGVQVVNVGEENAAPIGGYGPWEVSGPIYVTSAAPSRCVVASQPTHDPILAP